MINEIDVAWILLFSLGVLAQIVTPLVSGNKSVNSQSGLLSVVLLFSSTLLLSRFKQQDALITTLVISCILIINGYILMSWRFHPLRTSNQVVNNAIKIITTYCLLLAVQTYFSLTLNYYVLLQFIVIFLLSYRVLFWIRHVRYIDGSSAKTSKEPTVSVAVPARNETHALNQNLKSLVKSDYKKLELLVVDDCSQDNTAQIIRSFAHDGVRFINGQDSQGSWIGKNFAYKALSDEASGEIIVFSGVDTRYEPKTLGHLINYMDSNKLDMISVLPSHVKLNNWSLVIQPFRYMLMFARSSRSKPPVISTVWAIRSAALKKLGGFDAISHSINPEQYFARQIAKKNRYRFIVADPIMGLTTYKRPSSQKDTAIRYIYPSLHKSVFNTFVLSVLFISSIILPLPMLILYIISNNSGLITSIVYVNAIMGFVLYAWIVSLSYPRQNLLSGFFHYVIGSYYFIYLVMLSMVKYETDDVIWKGRNICQPVMLDKD